MQWEGEIIEEELAKLLENVRSGDIPVNKAVRLFKNFQFEDIGFAKIDHHRSLRKGFPEVIFGPGKTPAQIISIAKRMRVLGQPVFITRIDSNSAKSCLEALPESQFIPEAQAVVVGGIEKESLIPGVLLLSAGTSDIRVAEEAALTAKLLGSEVVKIFDVGISGVHRILSKLPEISAARVIIVVAGMDGALPTLVSGLASAPVIAVPTSIGYGANFGGITPLLTMLNGCSPGMSVVNIDNGFGAGYLAGIINRIGKPNPSD